MPAHNETTKDLDAKIAQNQRLLNEAQKWINLYGTLQNNLAVLKRAKALLEADDIVPEPSEYVHVPTEPQLPESEPQAAPSTAIPKPESPRNSIGALILTALTESGVPLPVQTILASVRAKGRSEVTLKTLGGVISQYLAKGVIRRTERATYALPSVNGNGTAMHDN